MRSDFAVIIISHGRPECDTVKTLRSSGYTGEIYLVVDDEDATRGDYLRIYGEEHIHMFHKTEWFDVGDPWGAPKTVGVFARNECLKVAREHGLTYYLEMDDDLSSLNFRYNKDGHLKGKKVTNFDAVVDAICTYFDESPIMGLGFGSAMDYIGGVATFDAPTVKRLFFNSFFLRASDDIMWLGRHSDDGITMATQHQMGKPWLKFIPIQTTYDIWSPKNNEKNPKGGSIAVYNELGAYRMRFYGVMYHPDCVKVKVTANNCDAPCKANNTCPPIISGRWRKA